MRSWTGIVFIALGTWGMVLVSCVADPSGPALTVAASSGATSTGSGSAGGADGGAGGATGTATTNTVATGGGQGGAPEMPVHGCTTALSTDMTNQATVTVNLPAGPFCVRVSQGTDLTMELDVPSAYRYRGGFYDDQLMIKLADSSSPIGDCCDISPFSCCPATSAPISLPVPGVYPWFDDKNPGTVKGVVYVE